MTRSRKILVSGGTGFVGRAVVARLNDNGYRVSVLTRKPTVAQSAPADSLIVGDMLVPHTVPIGEFDTFINCAGELWDTGRMRALHIDALRPLVERVGKRNGFHWIQLSSVGVYGPRKEGVVTEEDSFAPVGEYERTKAEGEVLIRRLCEARGIACTVLRPSNVFGIGMPNRSLAALVRSIQRGLFVYFGDPREYTMNYVHVDDVAASVGACLDTEAAESRIFNVSESIPQVRFVELVKSASGISRSTPQVPLALARVVGRIGQTIPGFPLTHSRVSALTVRALYSTQRLADATGFRPIVGIEKGLTEYMNALRTQEAP